MKHKKTDPPELTRRLLAFIGATLLIAIVALFLCLIPQAENDLFFELRIGSDILKTGHLPHFDTYSWVNRGTPWDVPEWLSFVLFTLAFRGAGFFGTWLLMAALTLAAASIIWIWLARHLPLAWAFLLTCLTLCAMSGCIQERPYAYSYLLLAICLVILQRAREGRFRLLLWLPPICALWTNLHQGVVVLIGLLLAYSLGDALTSLWVRIRAARAALPDLTLVSAWDTIASDTAAASTRRHARSAWLMLSAAAACAAAAMISPYGWRVYWNIDITLRNRSLMSNVTEWNSAFTLPITQLEPFITIAAIVFGSLLVSRRRNISDVIAVAALFLEALLHARNAALFAVGGTIIAARHLESYLQIVTRNHPFAVDSAKRRPLLIAVALLCTFTLGLVSLVSLRRAVGSSGYSPRGIGEAVAREPSYPANACAFARREDFPPNLRLFNDFGIGGYLMRTLPREPVFIDGRLDVYVGRTFDNMVILTRSPGSAQWAALVKSYNFDCAITTHAREEKAFAACPDWQLVYAEPEPSREKRCWILLRRRPRYAGLIARCLRDEPDGDAAAVANPPRA